MPLTKFEKGEIRDWANVQYGISRRYVEFDPIRSAFYRGRSVGMGKVAQRFNPRLPKRYMDKFTCEWLGCESPAKYYLGSLHKGGTFREGIGATLLCEKHYRQSGGKAKNPKRRFDPFLEELPDEEDDVPIGINPKNFVKLAVRKTVYRNEPGYLVYGSYNGYTGQKIFFSKESQAREFVRRIKTGEKSDKILQDIWKNPYGLPKTSPCLICNKPAGTGITTALVRGEKSGRIGRVHNKCLIKAYQEGRVVANPILESFGGSVVAGLGLGVGFKGVDFLAKRMRRQK